MIKKVTSLLFLSIVIAFTAVSVTASSGSVQMKANASAEGWQTYTDPILILAFRIQQVG